MARTKTGAATPSAVGRRGGRGEADALRQTLSHLDLAQQLTITITDSDAQPTAELLGRALKIVESPEGPVMSLVLLKVVGDISAGRTNRPTAQVGRAKEPLAEATTSEPRVLGVRLAEDVKRLRQLGQFTHPELAAILRVPQVTVSSWLRGERRPSSQYAPQILRAADLFLDRAVHVIEPEAIAGWIRRPLRRLDWASVIDTLTAGDFDTIDVLIEELEYPGTS